MNNILGQLCVVHVMPNTESAHFYSVQDLVFPI
jgi:hypothetical protein